MPDMNQIKKRVDEIFEEVVSLRRHIHMHPELSEHEKQTGLFIQKRLSDLGISHTGNVAGFGVMATVYGKDPSHGIGIRADIDALPLHEKTDVPFKSKNKGIMHGCGHDIHTAILLGAAQILNEIKDELPMSVRFIFQPSEETVGGAKPMIDAGCLKNPQISSVIALHVKPSVPVGFVEFTPGVMNAASCEFYATVRGRSCHGAHPSEGIDPLIPACSMVTAIQSIITRRMDPVHASLITVGRFDSGTKNNIIPGETRFSGIIRALDIKDREVIKKKLHELCCSIAAAHGAQCEIRFVDSYPSLVNDDELLGLVLKSTKRIIGEERIIVNSKPCLGADDFAYFCHEGRGLCYNIGTKSPDDNNPYPLHSDSFNPDEECIRTGILTETAAAIEIMNNEKKIWAEL